MFSALQFSSCCARRLTWHGAAARSEGAPDGVRSLCIARAASSGRVQGVTGGRRLCADDGAGAAVLQSFGHHRMSSGVRHPHQSIRHPRNTPGQSGGLRCKAGVSLHLPLSYPRQVDSTFPTQDASAPCTRPLPAAHAMHRLLTPSGAPSDLVAALYQVNLRAQQEENCSAENNAL